MTPPRHDELEVSIFGPGLGESLVLHLGGGDWVLVDSCRNAEGQNAGASYLESLGVDLSTSLKLIVLTHWHDDHIRGIGEVLLRCPQTRVAITSAVEKSQFLTTIAPWLAQNTAIKETIGLAELKFLGPTLKNFRPILASDNKILFEREGEARYEVRALSPSDTSILACIAALKDAPKIGRIPNIHGNHTSVVLSVVVGNRRLLLGADLEAKANRDHGWLAVVDSHTSSNRELYEVWKASHHGSSNGDHPEIWEKMVHKNPHVILSPFVNGSVMLPLLSDAERILARTSNAWISASPVSGKFKDDDRAVERIMRERARKLTSVPRQFGHVRLRSAISANTGDWTVENFGHAVHLNNMAVAS